jgi:hypothetical protein
MNSVGTASFVRRYAQLLTRAWCDDEFDELLNSDPRAALKEIGLAMSSDAEIAIMRTPHSPPDLARQLALWQDAAGTGRFVVHVPPLAARLLAAEELDRIVGGFDPAEFQQWDDMFRELLGPVTGGRP